MIMLLPTRCLLCKQHCEDELAICHDCRAMLPWHDKPQCQQCGLPLAESASQCGACLSKPPAYNHLKALFAYQPPISLLLSLLKYKSQSHLARHFGLLMANQRQQDAKHIDALVPVPLHASKTCERGFNQSLEIAKVVASALKLPLLQRFVIRKYATKAQTGSTKKDRKKQVKNAFAVAKPLACERVAIIDDTVTTASTVNAMSLVLKKSGVNYIEIWSVARTLLKN